VYRNILVVNQPELKQWENISKNFVKEFEISKHEMKYNLLNVQLSRQPHPINI